MSPPIGSVALVTHRVPSVSAEALPEVLQLMNERGIEVLIPLGERAKHPQVLGGEAPGCVETTREELAKADLCLVLGGDGTVLRTLRLTRGLGIPVAGLNLGRVGFFTTIRRDHIRDDLARILDGEYAVHPLLGLVSELGGVPFAAVNDVVISRGKETGVCRISYALNGEPLFDISCDAFVASTPAGSSAYNLAIGGPLMGIEVRGFVLSYVAPHTLAYRSLVAAASDELEIRNESATAPLVVVVDGEHIGTLDPLGSLEIRTQEGLASLALLPESHFYGHIRERFIRL